MKRATYLLVIVAFMGMFFACNKKDTTPPKIFLLGGDSETHEIKLPVESTYTDPGVTVNDNVDGTSLLNKVTVSHDIKGSFEEATTIDEMIGAVTSTGDYTVTYSVTDEAGNTGTATRNVTVYNEADIYAIDYVASKTSTNNLTPDYTDEPATIDYDTKKNKRIYFPKLSNVSGLKIYGDVYDTIINGSKMKYINIPYQEKEVSNYFYVVQGSYGAVIDTFWYTLRIVYQIDKRVNNNGTPGSLVKKDNVTETYVRL
ncbi:MAG: hypothetical protein Kow0068_13680 [Marinilabiliales bacterium]